MKRSSKGCLLKLSIAGVYTTIAHMISLNGPSPEVEETATPTLDQPGAGIPHDITGWVEPGTSDFEIYWDPLLAVHQALMALRTAPAVKQWQQAWPVGAATNYDGILKSLGPSAGTGEMLKASGNIQLADLPTQAT